MKKPKPTIEKKLLLQILSVLAAVVLWFAITYTEDPSINVTINGIALKTVGERLLDKNELIFVNREKLPNISVEVRGRRSDVQSVLNSITARIDLSDITEVGEYTRDVTYDLPNPAVMITKKKISTLNINIEKAISKEVPVYILQTGSEKNKEHLIESKAEIDTVKILGTQADVSRIKEVLCAVDVSTAIDDFSAKIPVSFADSNHNIITPENRIVSDYKDITIENWIYWRKSVNIALNPDLDMSEYQILVKSFSKEKVDIGVKSDDYDHITTIYADFASDIIINPNGKYHMKLKVPENVYCPAANDEITMTADIEHITTETLTLEINAENVPSGMTVHLNPVSITVELTGAKSKMENVRAKVDLSGLERGTYSVPVVFVTENTGVTVNEHSNITVTIE